LLSPSPSLLSLARHPCRHRHRSLFRPPPSRRRRRRRRRSPATLFAITIAIFFAVAVTLDIPFVTRPPPTSHLMLIVVSSPPLPWPSSLLVACRSRRTRHRPRHRCDRGRSPCSAMLPPAMRRVLTKDIRRLGGWLSPRRRASPPALSTLGTTINARRCARCTCPQVGPFLTYFGRYLVNGSNQFVGN
jgi:hypothetical protein